MDSFNRNIIGLLGAAIDGTTPDLSADIDFEAVFRTYPRLTPLLYFGALKSPLFRTCTNKQQILKKLSSEIAKSNKQIQYQKKLCSVFDKEGIEYCLLKGCELRELYPNPVMRPMQDCDILIKESQYDRITKVMLEEGYSFLHSSKHDHTWEREDGYQIELHCRFIAAGKPYEFVNTFVDKVQDHLLIPEYSFVYMIVHMAKHVRSCTVSTKSFLDIYIYRKKHADMDHELIRTLLEELGLTEFYRVICETIDSWFNNGECTEKTELLSDAVLIPYSGRKESSIKVRYISLTDSDGKIKIKEFSKKYIFPSFEDMAVLYPVLNKYSVLLPACWICRAVKVTQKHLIRKSKRDQALQGFDSEGNLKYKEKMEKIGIKM